jgi:hypothetical protein
LMYRGRAFFAHASELPKWPLNHKGHKGIAKAQKNLSLSVRVVKLNHKEHTGVPKSTKIIYRCI